LANEYGDRPAGDERDRPASDTPDERGGQRSPAAAVAAELARPGEASGAGRPDGHAVSDEPAGPGGPGSTAGPDSTGGRDDHAEPAGAGAGDSGPERADDQGAMFPVPGQRSSPTVPSSDAAAVPSVRGRHLFGQQPPYASHDSLGPEPPDSSAALDSGRRADWGTTGRTDLGTRADSGAADSGRRAESGTAGLGTRADSEETGLGTRADSGLPPGSGPPGMFGPASPASPASPAPVSRPDSYGPGSGYAADELGAAGEYVPPQSYGAAAG